MCSDGRCQPAPEVCDLQQLLRLADFSGCWENPCIDGPPPHAAELHALSSY